MLSRIPNSKFLILDFVLAGSVLLLGCGRKGPPLPPFVRMPVAPGDLAAARRGDTVDIKFVVPSANTDETRPANVERIDVYALTSTS
jgi:Prokaryotic lipoprotein-attachment site